MATYIETTDITDLMMLETGWSTELTAKVLRCNNVAVAEMLKRKGMVEDDVADTVPEALKNWCIAWVGTEMCFDAMGKNNVEIPDFEKYRIKYEAYKSRLKELENMLTPSVIAGTDYDVRDRATSMSMVLFRN